MWRVHGYYIKFACEVHLSYSQCSRWILRFEGPSLRKVPFMSITLSCTGLSLVNWDIEERNFEFIFGDSYACRVHKLLAEFLSPKVARMRKQDNDLSELTLTTASSMECYIAFEVLVSNICRGKAISVDKNNFENLVAIATELENTELISALVSTSDTEYFDIQKALDLLTKKTLPNSSLKTLTDKIASQFCDISDQNLSNLDLETLDLLLSSPSLRIKDEDSLYDFLRTRFTSDLSFASLLKHVYFEYLSVDRVQDFVEFAEKNLLSQISADIWRKLSRRLIRVPVASDENTNGRHASVLEKAPDSEPAASGTRVFKYDEQKPLNGIIAHLTRQCGGNVHDKGVVEVTASSDFVGQVPKNAADLEADTCFGSNNGLDTWLCYDFKDLKVTPTSYTIRSRFNGHVDAHNLKSWVIEVSNDGSEWQIVDQRDDNNDLNGRNIIHNFKISSEECRGPYRYVRLRQTGPNHYPGPYYYVNISSFEIFGSLFSE